jgi:hypothetical protein
MALRVQVAGQPDPIAIPPGALVRKAGGNKDAVTVAMLIEAAVQRAEVANAAADAFVAYLHGSRVDSSDFLVDFGEEWNKLEFSIELSGKARSCASTFVRVVVCFCFGSSFFFSFSL